MTTTTRQKPAAKTPEKTRPTGSRATGLVVGLLVAGVVAAIILALALGGTGDEAADSSAADAALIPTTGTVRQVSFADAAGTELPRFDSASALDPAVGQAAPAITASHFDNSEVTIDFADGQPRVVLFLAHWCPHCQAEVQSLVQRFEREGIRDDVEIVAISTDVDQGAPNYPPSQWFLAEQLPLPVLRDSASNDLAAGFGLSGFPFIVVVDADGTIVARQSGAVPDSQWNALLDLAVGSAPGA